jgi:pimeloyl-ACP methyl ester carboxylesterase
MKTILFCSFVAAALISQNARATRPPAELAAHVASASAGSPIKANAASPRGAAKETEITWSDDAGSARAWLLAPTAAKKHTLVIYLHQEGAAGNARSFIEEGTALAQDGIASLHVELPFSGAANAGANDGVAIAQGVRRAQHALAWARTQASVNGERVGVVGHRYGAMVGAILTAMDTKIDAIALLAPPGKPSGWLQVSDRPSAARLRDSFDKGQWGPYLFGLAKFDTEVWMPYTNHAKAFFQFAAQDDWTTTLEQVDLWRATKGTKERNTYEANSNLDDEARAARLAWLKRVMK